MFRDTLVVRMLSILTVWSCMLACAGATVVENFTITGNSLGDQDWSGYIPITSTYDNGTVYNTGAFGFNNGSW